MALHTGFLPAKKTVFLCNLKKQILLLITIILPLSRMQTILVIKRIFFKLPLKPFIRTANYRSSYTTTVLLFFQSSSTSLMVKRPLLQKRISSITPGMYLSKNEDNSLTLNGRFPAYPAEAASGGYNNINYVVTRRENYIAKTKGTNTFPWRAVIIASTDKELANNDMVYKLAEPSRISNVSWIKPGKVAWDWWNNRNLSHVNFKSGINTPTYEYFIDFASANKLGIYYTRWRLEQQRKSA